MLSSPSFLDICLLYSRRILGPSAAALFCALALVIGPAALPVLAQTPDPDLNPNIEANASELADAIDAAAGEAVDESADNIEATPATSPLARLRDLNQRVDTFWVLLSAALVFFMQAGFLMLETGLVRAKNTINVAMKNLFDYLAGFVIFFALGYALMFGESAGGWVGTTQFWLHGLGQPDEFAFFLFQVAFLGTAATIVSGAVAERTRFSAYAAASICISLVIYPLFGHWTWGGGWLGELGFVDFAGSTIVHALGGWVALAGVVVLGPRRDRFDEHGRPRKLIGQNLTQSVLGVFILWLGWFGFNGGSTLAFDDSVPLILLNTSVAAGFGGVSAVVCSWIVHRQPQIEDGLNGVIGGLVAITAGCHAFSPSISALLGVVAGLLVVFSVLIMEHVLRLDDVIAAFPVHAICGIWGTMAIGFFAAPEFFATVNGQPLTRGEQILVQLAGSVACAVWAFGLGLLLFWVLGKTIGVRVSAAQENEGLNISEHGARNSWIDLMDSMQHISRGEGDLRARIPAEIGTEAGAVAELFNRVIISMGAIIKEVQGAVSELGGVAANFSESATDLSTSVEQQSAQMEQIHAIMGNVNNALGEVSKFAQSQHEMAGEATTLARELQSGFTSFSEDTARAGQSAASGNQLADAGGQELIQLEAAMERIGGSTERIEATVEALDRISEQLNMLSLNASIEAARSGASGQGFAVVADEIHRLSDFTAQRTREATASLSEIQKEVGQGRRSLGEMSQSFRGVSREVLQLDARLTHLSDAGRKHAAQAGRIPELLSSLMRTAEHIMTGVQGRIHEVSEIYEALRHQSSALSRISDQAEELQTASQTLDRHSLGLGAQVGRFQT